MNGKNVNYKKYNYLIKHVEFTAFWKYKFIWLYYSVQYWKKSCLYLCDNNIWYKMNMWLNR
jgi:hypothetical protein